ncbi:MAG TPA: branched-chain amino acid ABC transporter permease [Thermodesulfobacteriota bacterium]
MFFQQLISGMAVGSIYALIALGFVIIYKATEVINFAQGELMVWGAFLVLTLTASLGLPLWSSLLLSLFLMALFGMLLEVLAIRRLVGKHVFSIVMATIGLSFVLRHLAGIIWSYDNFPFPSLFPRQPLSIMGLTTISSSHLGVIFSSFVLMALLYLFFKFTSLGLAMRASQQNQLGASIVGISVKRIFSMTWALAAILGAIAGILIAPVQFLNVNLGYLGLKAFPAAVLGGFGSIPGAIVGGLIIGISENLAGTFLATWVRDIFAYIILLGILMIRPEGIFGLQEKKRV